MSAARARIPSAEWAYLFSARLSPISFAPSLWDHDRQNVDVVCSLIARGYFERAWHGTHYRLALTAKGRQLVSDAMSEGV